MYVRYSWLAHIGANYVKVPTTRISQIQAFKISTLNSGHYISVVTIAKDHNSLRVPLIDYRFERWPVPQPCVHDCDVIFRGSRFRLFFQRHKMLPRHPSLHFRGELIIMRLSKTQTTNVVNLRAGDSKLARQIARRWAADTPHLSPYWFGPQFCSTFDTVSRKA